MYKNSPYKDIPEELKNEYTMNSKIPIFNWWLDGTKDVQLDWSEKIINSFLNRFTIDNIKNNLHGREDYPGASRLLLYAFLKYDVRNKKVAVVGSLTPWIEAILINLGNSVTTIEYNIPDCSFNQLTCSDYFNTFQKTENLYDVIVSFSSIEHSGLGRYGDPLDPRGDLKTMDDIYKNLKAKSLLILGIPVGADAFVWNVHRVYGRIRLPILLKNFNELEWFGFNKESLLNSNLRNNGDQPVIVLEKK